jgi:predicted acetyltransferase
VNPQNLLLRHLYSEDEPSFKKAIEEFNSEIPPWEFAFHFDSTADFAEYIQRLENWSHGLELPEKFVPNSYFVGVVDGKIVGRLSIRHCLNEFLRNIGGHIGYGVIPTQRKRGYATEMLRQALLKCAEIGLQSVLVTCDVDNIGSRRVIENCGGVFDGVTNSPELEVQKRRYWINTTITVSPANITTDSFTHGSMLGNSDAKSA